MNDYLMIRNWFFMDEEVYSVAKLRTLLSATPARKQDVSLSDSTALVLGILTSPYVRSCLVMAALCLAFVRLDVAGVVTVALPFVTSIVALYLIIHWLRPPPERVYMPMFACVCLVPLFRLTAERARHGGRWTPPARAFAVAVGVETLVVDDPQVVALAEVVAEAHVGRDHVGGAAVLEEEVRRDFGVERRLCAQPHDVYVEALVAVGKADEVALVLGAQFEETRHVPGWLDAQLQPVPIVKGAGCEIEVGPQQAAVVHRVKAAEGVERIPPCRDLRVFGKFDSFF